MDDKILFIAPYSHMAVLAQSVINSLKLKIPVIEAYDYKAIEALREYPNTRIVISRGGTSNFLRGVPGITVVDLTASFYDVAKSVTNLLKEGCRKIAVISQDNVIGLSEGHFELGKVSISVHPCRTSEDIISTVNACVKDGAEGIAGCVLAVETARDYGVRVAFVDADYFTMKKAVLEALEIKKTLEAQDAMLSRMETLLDNIEEGVIIFNPDGTPVFYNELASRLMRPHPLDHWHDKLSSDMKLAVAFPRVVNLGQHRMLMRDVPLKSDGDNLVILQDSTQIEETAKNMKVAAYKKGLYARHTFKDIQYSSDLMAQTVALARRFADSDSTVMLFGETGAGKEGFAQSIHNASPRSNKPFVSVNCASLPQGLVASELFGYVEGAFTGARRSGKKGLFELAQGGTIFLDEVTEIPLEVQSQFLRVIQEREVMRIGDDRLIPLDLRIICASNRQILPLCEEGKFRYDLYYRLNVLRLNIPPLRERGTDILLLFKTFVADFLNLNREELSLEPEVEQVLLAYRWPGNVRELRNVAEAVSFYGPQVRLEALQGLLSDSSEQQGGTVGSEGELWRPDLSFAELEYKYFSYMLRQHSLKEIAALSGISRTSLWRKLKALKLDE
ncbi:MAG: sigma 54-interacting transcriptional regulator [Succinivibrio sp.]|nr:sigma 54-interacting transcriptional regulator [Succinivibrio sp.]